MSHTRLHRYCRNLLSNISSSGPLSIEKICEKISEQRRRPLYIHSITAAAGSGLKACGMWIATDVADHIFVEDQTSKFHQAHIILHEVGHMLCGHEVGDYTADAGQFMQQGDFDAGFVASALARTSYSTRQERDAEMVASIMLERIASRNLWPLPRNDQWLGMSLGLIND